MADILAEVAARIHELEDKGELTFEEQNELRELNEVYRELADPMPPIGAEVGK